MQPITYSETRPRSALDLPFSVYLCAFLATPPTFRPIISYLNTGTPGLETWHDWVVMAALIPIWLFLILFAVQWAAWHRSGSSFLYRLTVGKDGLTYGNALSTWHWPWSELSPFEYVPGSLWRRAHVRFRPSQFRWKDRWRGEFHLATILKLRMARSSGGWEFYMLDSYDRPLTDIAAELNEYRDRALAAGLGR